MKTSNKKKFFAPIVITASVIVYFIVFGSALFVQNEIPILVRISGIVFQLILSGVMIYVMIERIKEIKKGEEDDLSKY